MKKIMEVYGELVLGLIVLVFLAVMLASFFADGTVSGMVEESVDAILGNTAAFEVHMGEAVPEAEWTGEKIPAGGEVVLLSYIKIKTASAVDWADASAVLTLDFSDFDVHIAAIHNVRNAVENVTYDSNSGKCRFPSAGAYQVNLLVTDKEKRTSSVSLCVIAEE